MFSVAIYIGFYAYLVLCLGLAGLLYKQTILITALVYLIVILLLNKNNITKIRFLRLKINKISIIFLSLIFLQVLINLLGALGPELSYDALWYHLTIPKIFLENHSIFHIPGGLFYYSDMPKLTEMLYIPALAINNEILAKLIHFSFGILALFALYKVSQSFLSKSYSVLTCLIFYSNLVVGWESISAYIDLSRTFYEIMTVWGFINYLESNKKRWLVITGLMLGFAISAKLLALGSLLIIVLLLILKYFKKRKNSLSDIFYIITPAFFVSLPWFILSYINTRNPIFPFFSSFYDFGINIHLLNPFNFVKDLWNLFMYSADPISPVYILFLPLIVIFYKKLNQNAKIIAVYSLISLLIWYITPRTGGGRFILPYLPAYSILAAASIGIMPIKRLSKFLVSFIVIVSAISIVYRGFANIKYLPVVFLKQSKNEFLNKNLNFSYGDFYDIDSYFKNKIKKADKVLIFGGHNLYYVYFPFVHESYIKKGDKFNYVLLIKHDLPKRFRHWNLVYKNDITNVMLYTLDNQKWTY